MPETAPAPAPRAAPRFPPGVAYLDGRYCDMSEAKISVLDWGFLRSDATYDVAHVVDGRFFRLGLHIERFLRSVERLRMTLPLDREELRAVLFECVRRSGLRAAYVEMICTRGFSPSFSRDPRDAQNTFIAFAIPYSSVADEAQRARGLDIAVSRVRRISPASVDPTVKNYHWLDLVAGLFEAYDRGAENVVLTAEDGTIAEGPGFNIFAVMEDGVRTPDRGVLEGITRRTAIELCRELGVPVAAAPLSLDALCRAVEVFITSTAGGIMPVTRVDGRPVGDGRPGPLTARLVELYWAKHKDPAWSEPVGYGA